MSADISKPKLHLHASASAWRLYSARKSDPKFKQFEEKIFNRDGYICQFCGFQAKKFQDLVNLDGNYLNNKSNNIVTACCFCTQCFFLESVGVGGFGGGTLIYLPELTQESLNSFCHVLFCAITNDTGFKSTAQTIYRDFKFRAQAVENHYGEGTSDPAIFGQLLIDSGSFNNEINNEIFKDIRLLPSRSKFKYQLEIWAQNAVDELNT